MTVDLKGIRADREMVTVKINGKEITVEDNTLILDAARDAGYEIPTFCYQADLMGIGSCRMCLVEIEGQKKLQPSCITPVLHGMSILTESSTVMSARASVLEFLLANHAMDCPVCDKGGECELQDAVHKYGPHHGRHAEKKFKFHEKDYILSPVIVKNSNRCVQCMKCVRVCREVVGQNVLGALGRGDHQEPTSFLRSYLDCDHDGNCIEVCPVGCFMRLPFRYKARPWDLKGADTVCPYCATGCRMVIEHRDGTVIRSKAQLGVGINSETLCARGRFGHDVINNAERLKTPLIGRYNKLEEAGWDETLGFMKDNLAPARGARTAGVAGARLTNEELYVFQKLMRKALGTPNVDSSSRFDSMAVEAFIDATGMTGGGVSVLDCMEADAVLVIGTHLSDENPVTDYIVRRISGVRRMNVITASVRAMKLDSSANVAIRHLPAGEKMVLDAIVSAIGIENAARLEGHDEAARIKAAGPEELAAPSGASVEAVKDAAARLGRSSTVGIMAGTEFLRFPEGIKALKLLVDVLKSLNKRVSVLPILDRCNQRGAWEMGVHPSFGPGYSVAAKGLGCGGILDAADREEIDALYVAGEDIVAMHPDPAYAARALSKVKFLVVQDSFMTETARLAHVVLPSAVSGEKDGTFTNQEGRVQSIKRLLSPPGRAKRDLDIFASVGSLFDPEYSLMTYASVFAEIRETAPTYKEVSLAFNNRKNIDNRLDIKEALVSGVKGVSITPSRFPATASSAGEGHQFRLVTGNHLFYSGRLTEKSAILATLLNGPVVELCPEDAAGLGLKDGERVRVKNGSHEAVLALKVRKGSMPGVAFVAENFGDVAVKRFFKRGDGIPGVKIERA